MGNVNEELDEAKAEIEKLKSENRRKEELFESLQKSQNEQFVKIQEASLGIEKQAQELIEKEGEISATKQMCEDIKCSLNMLRGYQTQFENEANLDAEDRHKHLEEVHDNLQEQIKTSKKEWEVEKSKLTDEVNSLQTRLDSQTRISEDLQKRSENEEIQRKHLEAQDSDLKSEVECSNGIREEEDDDDDDENGTQSNSLGSKETRKKATENQDQKQEQENSKDQQQEQENSKDRHESSSKSSIAKLRIKLKAAEHKYRYCAKTLKAKEAEWSSQQESMTRELNECRSELEIKDRTIEELMTELEDSHSLMMELKLQIEQSEGGSQLRQQLEDCKSELLNNHSTIEDMLLELEDCHSLMTHLKLQNDEYSSQLDILRRECNECRTELDGKDRAIEELMVELESCHSLMTDLKLQIQESELSSQLEKMRNDNDSRSELESKDRIIEELLTKLEDSHALVRELKLQNEEATWRSPWEKMTKDFNYSRSAKEDNDRSTEELMMELEGCHSQIMQLMLQNEETSVMLMILKSGISEAQMKFISEEDERDMRDRRYKVMLAETSSALETANNELGEKICEVNEIEFELQIWMSFVERLKVNLDENNRMRKELEASLLEEVEIEETFKQEKSGLMLMLDVKDRKIDSLQQQFVVPDQELKTREREPSTSARVETEMSSESNERSFSSITKDNSALEDLRKQLGLLEQESLRRELEGAVLAQIAAERTIKHEKQNLIQLVGEKKQRIDDLMHRVTSLEENFNRSLMSFSSQLSDKQAEINLVSEAWEKITSAEIMAVLEIEEKKLMIVELENEIHNIQQKLEMQDKSIYDSKQQAIEIEADLEAKQSEMNRLTGEMEYKMRNSDELIHELRSEKRNLAEEIMKLLSERESLRCLVRDTDGKIDNLSGEDVDLMEMLGRIVKSFNDKVSVEHFGSRKENVTTHSSPTAKTLEVSSDGRSPFREVNS